MTVKEMDSPWRHGGSFYKTGEMKKSRSQALLEKSVAAAVSAIEIYNKPDFQHREETFAILMVNAWELLMKARILKENKNKLSSIYVVEPVGMTKSGVPSKKLRIKKNWANVPITIGLYPAMKIASAYKSHPLDKICAESINTLVLIRDASVHFMNADSGLSLRVQTFGTASLKNYLQIVQDWFNYDLGRYNFYLMPVSFFPLSDADAFSTSRNPEIKNLIRRLAAIETEHAASGDSPYSVSLRLDVKFVKVSSANALQFQKTNDPHALKVMVTEEEDLKDTWTHAELVKKLSARYSDFKVNQKFNKQKKSLESDLRYAKRRYANPKTKKGSVVFYRSAILNEFDKVYTRFKP